jgi:hypothetical protein
MPRTAKTTPTRRLSLEMTEPVRERLENLRDQTEADSLTEVIRRSLAVYDYLWGEKSKGGKILIRTADKDGKPEERELVLL